MSYYEEWNDLISNQTDATYEEFWERYTAAEKHIYGELLKDNCKNVTGTFKELTEKYNVDPVLFMGFLDGVNSSLIKEIDNLDKITEDTKVTFDIDPPKLYFNMHAAKAQHLYTLPQWDEVLSHEEREEIEKEYKKSKTIVKDKTPGRNDPCPCGSGKKYKKCCGAV